MKIRDNIYGVFEINSPVLVELIQSKPLKRLKSIAQFGPPDEFYHKKNYKQILYKFRII